MNLFQSGCGKPPKGGPREATYPITGVVTVDGNPETQVQVTCHPVSESKLSAPSVAYTNADGEFSIGTYEAGDGAPAGDYKLTFRWGQINLMTGRYDGDKFKGKYAKVESSEFPVTVTEGQECDLGPIALTTK
ncbi:MAG: hypothetical protein R3C59_23330 [Planctomycetaceae bacterium]